jgi:hypothetical protein
VTMISRQDNHVRSGRPDLADGRRSLALDSARADRLRAARQRVSPYCLKIRTAQFDALRHSPIGEGIREADILGW